MSAKQSANEQQERAAELASKSAAEPSSKQDTPSKKPSNPTAPPKASAKAKSSWLMGLVLLLVLLTITGTAALGWLGYQQLIGLQQQLVERPTHQELQAPLNDLTAISDLKEQQQYLQQTINNNRLELADVQQTLMKSSDPKPRDWQLAEVEYLLRLANQRLQLEEDVEGAINLMETADQRLKQANVPGTLGVRSHLLEDIAELKALTKLDRVSMALSLQKLADKALILKVKSLSESPTLNLEAVIQPDKNLNWYQRLWQEVRSLVIIRKHELPLEALPFTEDELALRHQLSALLLQSSWAALRGEQQLYEVSLAGAAKRLVGFDANQPEVDDFTKQLEKLAAQPVKQKLPETETSLDSLQAFIAQRYNLKLPIEPEGNASEAVNSEEQP